MNHALPAWMVPDPEKLGQALIRVAITVAVAWLLQRLGFLLVRRAEHLIERAAHGSSHARQRARTLGNTTRHLITTVVAVGAVLYSLAVLGWDVRPILVGASILGASLGFGAQSLVRDLIAGAFILIEDQFSVGEVVDVNGVAATVEDVTLRSTRLRDYQGRLLFVPNGEMRIVINHSRDWSRSVIDLPLAANQDLSRALAAAMEAAAEVGRDPRLQAESLEPPQVVGIERIGPEGAVLRVVARTRPGAGAALVAREMRRLALQRLREAGLRPAGPEVSILPVPSASAEPPRS
jgi:small conductance mechanosensitive channel